MIEAILQKADSALTFFNWWAFAPRAYQTIGIVAALLFIAGLGYFRFFGADRITHQNRLQIEVRVRDYERRDYRIELRDEESVVVSSRAVWNPEIQFTRAATSAAAS